MEITKASGAYFKLLQHRAPPSPIAPTSLHSSLPFSYSAHRRRRKAPSTSTKSLTTATSNSSSSSGSISTVIDPALALKKRAVELSPELKGTCIFLVGMNTSLKSTLGKLLADGLRYYYFDSDSLVEEALGGKLAAKSLLQTDEKAFRDSETEVLKQLSSMGRLVVSAGNGAVQCTANLALLRHGISIWIDIPLDMVAKEVLDDTIQLHVPELSVISESYSEVMSQLGAIYKDNHSGYSTADTTISLQKVASKLGYDDLNTVTTEDLALEVLKALEKLVRLRKMMEEASRPF